MDRACGEFSDVDVIKKPCSTLLEEMNDKVGEFDVYNIYDTCGHDRSGNRIPRQRTFAIGFSFGGGMVYRLMCEASDIIFGFAVVAQPGPFSQQASIYGSGHGSSWSQSCHPACLLYTSPSPRDMRRSRMPSSA